MKLLTRHSNFRSVFLASATPFFTQQNVPTAGARARRRNLQRSPLLCAPGLVKFTPAVAYLLCLALPGSFLNMFAQNKGDLCSCNETVILS